MKYTEPGPWDDEPDSDVFETHGLECQMMRAEVGHWCGYVVSPKQIGNAEDALYVHGGVSWDGDRIPLESRSRGIGAQVIGFDCGHPGDVSPKNASAFPGNTYRTYEYAKSETIRLAKQVAQILDEIEE